MVLWFWFWCFFWFCFFCFTKPSSVMHVFKCMLYQTHVTIKTFNNLLWFIYLFKLFWLNFYYGFFFIFCIASAGSFVILIFGLALLFALALALGISCMVSSWISSLISSCFISSYGFFIINYIFNIFSGSLFKHFWLLICSFDKKLQN